MPKAKTKRTANATSFKPGASASPDFPGFKPKAKPEAEPQTTEATVLALASLDLSNATIADALGLTVAAFAQLRKDDPVIANALAVGRGKAEDRLIRNLQRLAKHNFVPSISMLKARHGYREADPETEGGNHVTIVIPGASPGDRLIEGDTIIDDDEPIEGVNVVHVPKPKPVQNGAAPRPTYDDPEPEPRSPPARPQTGEERAVVRQFESKVGINSYDPPRSSFRSEAAYRRWLAPRRPSKE
jgi:hypothetical protein